MSASFPTCHHLHPTGMRCGSPALRGEQFCFYHHPTRRPPTRVKARTPFHVPAITDPEALQITLSEVIRRLADNTLDTRRASLLLLTLQMAKTNLPALPRYPPSRATARPRQHEVPRPRQYEVPRQRQHEVPDHSDLSELLSLAGLQPIPSV